MSDYIKREDAISIIRRRCKKYTTICVAAVTELQELPPADVRENVKAKKKVENNGVVNWLVCSNCLHDVDIQDNFCRHCGADMKGDNNDRTNR